MIRSFNERWHRPLMPAYAAYMRVPHEQAARHYVEAANAAIEAEFTVRLGSDEDFTELWNRLGAEGDIERALGVWRRKHNATRKVVGPDDIPAGVGFADTMEQVRRAGAKATDKG